MAGAQNDSSGDNAILLVILGPRATIPGANAHSEPKYRIFHEFDDDHPNKSAHGGEALVTHDQVVWVANTTRVRQALADRFLVDVTGKRNEKTGQPYEATPQINVADLVNQQIVDATPQQVAPALPPEVSAFVGSQTGAGGKANAGGKAAKSE